MANTPSYPKDQCSGPRHCRYVRPGHLHPRPALSSPPQSAWNGPPDHQLKKFFRCAGRQVKAPLLDKALFSSGGARRKKVEYLCRRRSLPDLCRSARLRPVALEQGRACACFCVQVDPVELRLLAFSCRMSARCPSLRSWLLRRHAPSCSLACTRSTPVC